MTNIDNENVEAFLAENEITILDFWAPWCPPCKILSKTLSEISTDREGGKIDIGMVNVDNNADLGKSYFIRGLPTILFFKKGELVDKFVGNKSKEEIEAKIDQLLS